MKNYERKTISFRKYKTRSHDGSYLFILGKNNEQ